MNRFAARTFTPDPRAATVPKMLAAQFALELKLLLRNGEQLLLTLFIPVRIEQRPLSPRSWRWR